MPEHFHLLITPSVTLERAIQFVKGGFSYRAKKELQSSVEIWQVGFSDHRIRDAEDYSKHIEYIYRNPVGRNLVERAKEYSYGSAFPGSVKDEVPQWLKPLTGGSSYVAPEGATLQARIGRGLKPAGDDKSKKVVTSLEITSGSDEELVTNI